MYLSIGVYAVVSLLLLFGLDYTVTSSSENIRTLKLQNHSEGDLRKLTVDIELLSADAETLRNRISELTALAYPNLSEFKGLAQKHRLKLDKMERVRVASEQQSELSRYATTLVGTAGGLVRFLRALETQHILSCDQITVYPVDDEGKVIGMVIAVMIDESR